MSESSGFLGSARLLIFGLVAVIIVLGGALIVMAIGQAGSAPEPAEQINVLANSTNECVECHQRATPGIVEQYGHSSMAAAEVTCQQCHQVAETYPGAEAHEGTFVLASPTTSMCQKCHVAEVAQYNQSRHSLPAFVAVAGTEELSADLINKYQAIPEGGYAPNKARNAIAQLEGPDMTRFTCFGCHNIGRPAADGSVGQCQKCHLRHEFSLEQARKPETCNFCHIGPDHPQWEIYHESPHGIAYSSMGHNWNWEAEPGTLTVNDFPAPTCSVCHMSGFGTSGTTHDVGDRLTWYLFAPISERRPSWEDNKIRMQSVCMECHNETFIGDFYSAADKATGRVNEWVKQSDEMIQPLVDAGKLTSDPFDEPIDFVYFELWHHWGRTAKFGAWMQGPDYSQWHGAYEVLADLAELRKLVDEKMQAPVTGQ
jgi:hydroxylamine dehydrogenase